MRQPFASLYFFPVAAAYAALILPWSVLAQFGAVSAPDALRGSIGHAHEMLFGFTMAVVAGYILGPQPKRWIFSLLGLWVCGRLTFLSQPYGLASAVINVAFVALLAYRVVPRFARSAKKWRNKAVAPIIAGLCLAGAIFQGLFFTGRTGPLHGLLFEVILLLSTLMFFMGGRMLAPAVAGHLLRQNRNLDARVQPRLEGGVLILLGSALVLNMLPWAPARIAVGMILVPVAALTLARLSRWRIWRCLDRPDLLALALGYLWLVAGWLLISLALLTGSIPLSTAIHGLTTGAVGTLTLTVMARTRAQRSHREIPALAIGLTSGLITTAAVARLIAGLHAPNVTAHQLAAASWGLAFVVLLIFLLRLVWLERNAGNAPSKSSGACI